jgi:hypothetical protein
MNSSVSTGGDGWCSAVSARCSLAVRTLLPESPRWLESRGRHAVARDVVDQWRPRLLEEVQQIES